MRTLTLNLSRWSRTSATGSKAYTFNATYGSCKQDEERHSGATREPIFAPMLIKQAGVGILVPPGDVEDPIRG